MLEAASGAIGVLALLVIAVMFSARRGAIQLSIVVRAFLLQVIIGVVVLKVPAGQAALAELSRYVLTLIDFTQAGVEMVFGSLIPAEDEFSFFVQVLPIIVFFSALMSVLYHLQIMQYVVAAGGWVLRKLVGLRPLESLNAVANIFIGQAESPLTLRPLLRKATDAQIFAIMVSGMASVSGTVMAAYTEMGIQIEYLVAASCMAAPGGLLMGHLFFPEKKPAQEPAADALEAAPVDPQPMSGLTGDAFEADPTEPDENNRYVNVIMAAAIGAEKGLILAAKIGAMLLAFVALIALTNGVLSGVGGWFGVEDLTIQRLLGYVFAPVMIAVGTLPSEAILAGGIFGEKLVTNEFIAYLSLSEVLDTLSPKSAIVVTFALCGFANISSIAILLGGLGSMAPAHRTTIARLGLRAVIAASFSNLMSAALAGIIVSV